MIVRRRLKALKRFSQNVFETKSKHPRLDGGHKPFTSSCPGLHLLDLQPSFPDSPLIMFSTLLLTCFPLFSLYYASPLIYPLSLYDHINHNLSHGGLEQLQRHLHLPPAVYYHPLIHFERDDIPNSPHHTLASDLSILRALSLHLPGIDPLPSLSRQSDDKCSQSNSKLVRGDKSEFIVAYSNTTPLDVQRAVEFAVLQWAHSFESQVTTRICFRWDTSGGLGESTLGAASSPYFVSGDKHDALRSDAMYSPALASSLVGEDVMEEDEFHVNIFLNSRIRWHFDINTRAPLEEFDCTTTVMHELAHGLFFSGTINASPQKREAFLSGAPGRFDQFMVVANGAAVAKTCARNSTNLFNAITNPSLRFVDEKMGADFRLHAPGRYKNGSSTYHFETGTLDDDCRTGDISTNRCSDLMTHQLNAGYTQRAIGETTMRVLEAMRSNARGADGNTTCNLPRSPLDSEIASESHFKLPPWGIATVAVVAGVGAILVAGVIMSSVAARRVSG